MNPNQKIDNLVSALNGLKEALLRDENDPVVASGIVKNFEIVYELSWKVLKEKLAAQGIEAAGPRDVFQMAWEQGLVTDDRVWKPMILDRNLTVHTYNRAFALALILKIRGLYTPAFEVLVQRLLSRPS